tara:strand:+ start:5027 stop:5998 length:972 start_codon:yes stop_codon:yes gene_type:complete
MLTFSFIIAMTVTTGFICTLIETTLINISPTFLRHLKEENPVLAKQLKQLHDDFEINQSALAGVSTLLIVFGAALIGLHVTDVYGSTAVPMAAFCAAIAMVALTQVLPRAVANHFWQKLGPFAVATIPTFKLFAAPFTLMTALVQKLGLGRVQEPVIRSEIETITEQGYKDGAIEAGEYQLLNNVLQFKQWRLIDIMVQRGDLVALDPDDSIESAHALIANCKNNKFPLFGRIHNETVGYVNRADLAEALLNGDATQPVRTLARSILTVPHNMRARKLLTKFRKRECEIALIVDDYGEVIGMVAQEDMLETLFDKNEVERSAA